MSQTRTESFVETVINTASGFILSLLVWSYIVAPLYGIEVNQVQNLTITSIFTVSSVLRSYLWRRFFAVSLHKKLHSLFKSVY